MRQSGGHAVENETANLRDVVARAAGMFVRIKNGIRPGVIGLQPLQLLDGTPAFQRSLGN